MNIALVLIWVGILIFLAHAFALIFKRTKIPDVLWLIIIGLVLGPLFGIVTPADFGSVGQVFLPATLVVILFEGGIGLKLKSLVKAMRESLALSTLNFFATMIVVGVATFLLTDSQGGCLFNGCNGSQRTGGGSPGFFPGAAGSSWR